jgi:large subunit ribosomal protein L13
MKTWVPKKGEIEHRWYVVDASGQTLGRLATDIARVLRGKHKPTYTPNQDLGDFVVVVNASKIAVTGTKLTDKKYYQHSGYPGGLRTTTLQQMLERHPERVIEKAVRGMLPHTKLGEQMFKKLKVYPGPEHPHRAQQPVDLGAAFGGGQPTGARYHSGSEG